MVRSVYIKDSVFLALQAIADRQRRSVNSLFGMALDDFIEKNKNADDPISRIVLDYLVAVKPEIVIGGDRSRTDRPLTPLDVERKLPNHPNLSAIESSSSMELFRERYLDAVCPKTRRQYEAPGSTELTAVYMILDPAKEAKPRW